MKLPVNCSVEYINDFLSESDSKNLYEELIEVFKIDQLRTKIITNDGVTYTDNGKLMFIDEALFKANKFPEAHWGKSAIWSAKLHRKISFDQLIVFCF